MLEYHKIHTVFKRDTVRKGALIIGDWALPEFEYLAKNKWLFSEKVNGMNIRVMYADGNVTFGGKTDAAQLPAQLVQRLNERFLSQVELMRTMFGDVTACLYGEGYGAKIKKGGGNYRADQDFVLFDAWVDGYWLQRVNVKAVAASLGIDTVPEIGNGTLYDALDFAEYGFYSAWGSFPAEGIVLRPEIELIRRNGNRIITKIKCSDFFKKEET